MLVRLVSVLSVVALALLSAVSLWSPVWSQTTEEYSRNQENIRQLYADYDMLLSKHLLLNVVKNDIIHTGVDYAAWSQDPLYKKVMFDIRRINPEELSRQDQMAFWINAYNLFTVDLIIKTNEKKSIRRQGSLLRNVWKTHLWEIRGYEYSLHQIEHKILRPMDEARIHFAINCASLSCPDLYEEAYEGSRLTAQLLLQEKRFMENPTKGIRIEPKAGKGVIVHISAIFRWYDKDFGGKRGIIKLIKDYAKQDDIRKIHKIHKHKDDMKTMNYDWALNGDW